LDFGPRRIVALRLPCFQQAPAKNGHTVSYCGPGPARTFGFRVTAAFCSLHRICFHAAAAAALHHPDGSHDDPWIGDAYGLAEAYSGSWASPREPWSTSYCVQGGLYTKHYVSAFGQKEVEVYDVLDTTATMNVTVGGRTYAAVFGLTVTHPRDDDRPPAYPVVMFALGSDGSVHQGSNGAFNTEDEARRYGINDTADFVLTYGYTYAPLVSHECVRSVVWNGNKAALSEYYGGFWEDVNKSSCVSWDYLAMSGFGGAGISRNMTVADVTLFADARYIQATKLLYVLLSLPLPDGETGYMVSVIGTVGYGAVFELANSTAYQSTAVALTVGVSAVTAQLFNGPAAIFTRGRSSACGAPEPPVATWTGNSTIFTETYTGYWENERTNYPNYCIPGTSAIHVETGFDQSFKIVVEDSTEPLSLTYITASDIILALGSVNGSEDEYLLCIGATLDHKGDDPDSGTTVLSCGSAGVTFPSASAARANGIVHTLRNVFMTGDIDRYGTFFSQWNTACIKDPPQPTDTPFFIGLAVGFATLMALCGCGVAYCCGCCCFAVMSRTRESEHALLDAPAGGVGLVDVSHSASTSVER